MKVSYNEQNATFIFQRYWVQIILSLLKLPPITVVSVLLKIQELMQLPLWQDIFSHVFHTLRILTRFYPCTVIFFSFFFSFSALRRTASFSGGLEGCLGNQVGQKAVARLGRGCTCQCPQSPGQSGCALSMCWQTWLYPMEACAQTGDGVSLRAVACSGSSSRLSSRARLVQFPFEFGWLQTCM